MKKLSIICAGLAATLLGTSALAAAPESTDPIKIVVNNWGSQLVLSHVTGDLLEGMGYKVEYVPSNTQVQFPAIGKGDAHIQVEVWEGTMRPAFLKEVDAGNMIDGGTHQATSREEWWYPAYMEEKCPGLPDWQALQKCHEVFATAETAPMGRFLGGAVEWEKHDEERIKALGMDFQVIYAGSTTALISELQAAYDRKEPLVMFNYKPNWVLQKFDGKFVEFPVWDEKCSTDPSWGTNKDLPYDCGTPASGWLKKAMWSGMADKYPCAAELIKAMSFTDDMIGDGFYFVDVDKMSEADGAKKFAEKYAEAIAGWKAAVPASCKAN